MGSKDTKIQRYKDTKITLIHFPCLVKDDLGFSLISMLIAVFIMGIIFTSILSMMTLQSKEGHAIKQQLARASVKYSILQTLKKPENCTCQFNNIPPTKLTINTEKAKPGRTGDEITFTEFTTGCGSSEVIAQAGMNVGAGVQIQSVKVSEIMETSTPLEYSGNLIVTYHNSDELVRSMKSTLIPLTLTIYASRGSPNAREIYSCGANTNWTDRINDMKNELVNLRSHLIGQFTQANNDVKNKLDSFYNTFTIQLDNLDTRVTANTDMIDSLTLRIAALGVSVTLDDTEEGEDEKTDEESYDDSENPPPTVIDRVG